MSSKSFTENQRFICCLNLIVCKIKMTESSGSLKIPLCSVLCNSMDGRYLIGSYLQLPLLHKDLFSSGLRKRSGVLLYGPPGTGKVCY